MSVNTGNGLPSNTVYQVMQDSKGYIWIAHEQGLSRYDGKYFKTFSGVQQSNKAGSNIKEDVLGRIWYQTFDGYVYYVEHDSMHALKYHGTSIGFTPYGLMDSTLAVVSKGRVDLYHIRTLQKTVTVSQSMIAFAASFSTRDQFYISYNDSCLAIDAKGRRSKIKTDKGCAVLTAEGRLFSINRNHFDGIIYELKNGRSHVAFQLPGVNFTQGIMYQGGNYWVCTPEGIWMYKGDGTLLNNGKVLFPGKNISGVCKDREGNYWFSTLNEGLLFVPDIRVRMLSIPNAIPYAVTTGREGLYIATNKNEVYSYEPFSSTLKFLYKDEVTHQVNDLVADDYNNKLLVSAQYLKVFDERFATVQQNVKPVKTAIVLDEKYYAYAASGTAGMMQVRTTGQSEWDSLYYSGDVVHNGTDSRLLTESRFRYVACNSAAGLIYFSGSKGLFRFSQKDHQPKELLYRGEKIFVLHMRMYTNRLVVITTGNKVLFVDGDDMVTSVEIGEASQLYKTYNIDSNIYLLTNAGAKRYDEQKGKFVNSDMLNGIKGEDMYDIETYNNLMVLATSKGIITMPRKLHMPEVAPLLYITGVTVNGQPKPVDSLAYLKHKENSIEIFFATPVFRNPGKYPVLYKINDEPWVVTTVTERSLKLASLSPGNYTISFAQDMGQGNIVIKAVVNLAIQSPFWRTLWFWVLIGAVLAVLVYLYYKWQTGLLKKQNQLLTEKVVLERNLHKSVLTAIRSQMNPHFFYNALNTIQAYIIGDDKRNAATYLSKFSKLTRTILEMTGKESVTLSEEVSALRLYLDLEKVRFNNELNYSVNVMNGLEVDMVKIPSMIVQPYVENSIKHGLLHKNGEKLLLVDFFRRDTNLCIVIDDNGIGRKKSGELNKIRADKHKPFATEANMKRIEILNQGNNNIGVVYTDKTDSSGQSNGTIVTITIPLINKEA